MYALCLILLSLTVLQLSAELRVGVASVEITPEVGIDRMRSMNGELELVQSVHDPVYGKALVLDTEEGLVALLSFDLLVLENELFREMRRRILEETGIEQVVCTVTHTRLRRSFGGLWPQASGRRGGACEESGGVSGGGRDRLRLGHRG